MNDLLDPRIAIGLGALAGLIVNGTRARSLGRFLPPLALALIVAGMFTPSPIPTPLQMALIGAGTVISVVRLFGGK